jgi:protein LSM14
LSLITKAESRYEGTLFEVDRVNKTMSLKNVKNYGTEGRRNGENEIPKSDPIIASVKFRVDLIKTFKIIEQPSN